MVKSWWGNSWRHWNRSSAWAALSSLGCLVLQRQFKWIQTYNCLTGGGSIWSRQRWFEFLFLLVRSFCRCYGCEVDTGKFSNIFTRWASLYWSFTIFDGEFGSMGLYSGRKSRLAKLCGLIGGLNFPLFRFDSGFVSSGAPLRETRDQIWWVTHFLATHLVSPWSRTLYGCLSWDPSGLVTF